MRRIDSLQDTLVGVVFLHGKYAAQKPSSKGTVSYRLARNRVLRELESGAVTPNEVCDAQRELIRIAENCSDLANEPCPICAVDTLVNVQFVFGPRLPPGGRVVTSKAEFQRLQTRRSQSFVYEIEVCPRCRWNHLMKITTLGGAQSASA